MDLPAGPTRALAYGGPVDGSSLGDDSAAEYEVVTSDRARWRYVRTDQMEENVDQPGTFARIYRCLGRI